MFDRDQSTMRGTDGGELTAFLGKGTRITGTLVFEGPCRIEGHVEGEVVAKDTLTIGETAAVNASVHGAMVVVHGTVTGNVVAETRLEIRDRGTIVGDVTTPRLIVNEGATLEGRCSMRSTAKAETTRAESPPAPATQLQAG